MAPPDRARDASRIPLLVFVLALAAGLALYVLGHDHVLGPGHRHLFPDASTAGAPADPQAVAPALPASAPGR